MIKPRKGSIKKKGYNLDYYYIPVTATPDQVKESSEFAKQYAAVRGELYAEKRNQKSVNNIEDQVRTSKIFEFMIYNYLKGLNLEDTTMSPPSTEIYSGRKRPKFDDDLTLNKNGTLTKLHIKSQDIKRIHERAPLSWGFQVEDPLFTRKKDDIMVLGVFLDDHEGQLISKDYVRNFSNELADPKKDYLKGIKKFLYFDPTKPTFSLVKV